MSYERTKHNQLNIIYIKLKVERESIDDSTMINYQNTKRSHITYHYRTYNEFYEFFERLNRQFPLIGLDLKFSRQTEDKMLAQRRVSDINDFLRNLFRLTTEVMEVSSIISLSFSKTNENHSLFSLILSLPSFIAFNKINRSTMEKTNQSMVNFSICRKRSSHVFLFTRFLLTFIR